MKWKENNNLSKKKKQNTDIEIKINKMERKINTGLRSLSQHGNNKTKLSLQQF